MRVLSLPYIKAGATRSAVGLENFNGWFEHLALADCPGGGVDASMANPTTLPPLTDNQKTTVNQS
jgi:hypothetical protein